MDSFDESEKQEETYLCPVTNYELNKVNNLTLYFTYNELFLYAKCQIGIYSVLEPEIVEVDDEESRIGGVDLRNGGAGVDL